MKKTEKRMFVRAIACFFLFWLIMLPVAHAAIPMVSPEEGTVGTVFTITGAAFGAKTGKVYIGSQSCKVLKWNDSSIDCKIKKVLPPGEYDLLIRPKGGEECRHSAERIRHQSPETGPAHCPAPFCIFGGCDNGHRRFFRRGDWGSEGSNPGSSGKHQQVSD